jgi:small acid-soluble spore protein (thioredoxin-like protein)
MKSKPDNRKDNVEHIQKNIDMTIHNMEAAEDMIERTPDDKMKHELEAKNDRREKALESGRLQHKIQPHHYGCG